MNVELETHTRKRINNMNDYETSKKFWDDAFKNLEVQKVDQTWIKDPKILDIFKQYINKETLILDYGTGSGWFLFEIALRKHFKEAVGVDTSKNCIEVNNKIAELSEYHNMKFLVGDQDALKDYPNYFDFVWNVNVFDVLPEDIIEDILPKLYDSMKPGALMFVGLNPDFTEEELVNMLKMEKKGHYYYKDNVLRANKHTIPEWISFFSKKFTVVEQFTFELAPQDKQYPRIGLLLKK